MQRQGLRATALVSKHVNRFKILLNGDQIYQRYGFFYLHPQGVQYSLAICLQQTITKLTYISLCDQVRVAYERQRKNPSGLTLLGHNTGAHAYGS